MARDKLDNSLGVGSSPFTRSMPSVLVAVSSSCQLYSGTGTALFDWIRFSRHALSFSLLIDVLHQRNFEIAKRFCDDLGIRLFPSPPNPMSGCPDAGIRDAASVIRSGDWDFIECMSWASAATNLDVLSNKGPRSRLLFTPHTQPIWTLPSPHRYFMVPVVLKEMLENSDAVFIDSPGQIRQTDGASAELDEQSLFIPLGVDTKKFHFCSVEVERKIFSLCDFREHRKRPDLLFQSFAEVRRRDPRVRLVIGGNGSVEGDVPPPIQHHVTRLGYITTESLIREYQSAKAFVLLSDYEAFGIPIAEALCCGTPVIINRQPQLVDIFGGLPGVHFVTNSDLGEVGDTVLDVLGQEPDRSLIARAAAEKFNFEATYGKKLSHVLRLQASIRGQAARTDARPAGQVLHVSRSPSYELGNGYAQRVR